MTFKNLMDELSGVSIEDYDKLIAFVQELKTKQNTTSKEFIFVKGLTDWTIADENWNENEIW